MPFKLETNELLNNPKEDESELMLPRYDNGVGMLLVRDPHKKSGCLVSRGENLDILACRAGL